MAFSVTTSGAASLGAAVLCLTLSSTIRAQSLTPYAIANGYSLSTFATGFPATGAIGPLGIYIRGDGKVLVTTYNGEVRIFPFDTPLAGPAQVAPGASLAHGLGDAIGVAVGAGGLYMTQQTSGLVVKIDDGGALLGPVASVPHATGICGFPAFATAPGTAALMGHLFVTTAGGPAASNVIWEVDPAAPFASAASVFIADAADGLTFTLSGAYLVAAAGAGLRMYDSVTKALVFEAAVGGSDGIAIGTGALAGRAYSNTTTGEVVEVIYDQAPGVGPEIDPPASGVTNLIMTGGSRGDFIAVDRIVNCGTPTGLMFPSLLLTQTSSILRLDPPLGGWFGPPDMIPGPASGALAYGCINPPGSLKVLSGTPKIGTVLTLGVTNPLGTQGPGSLSLLFIAGAPFPLFPCGLPVLGWGMGGAGAPGELLLDPSGPYLFMIGPLWFGPNFPAPFALPIPASSILVGYSLYAQGVLYDPVALQGVQIGMANALKLTFGF